MSTQRESVTSTITRIKKPSNYHVVLHNDNTTSMEFVVWLLVNIFNHPEDDAHTLMMNIHNNGKQVVGTYSRDVAETKVAETKLAADGFGYHDLTATVEEE